MDQYLYPYYIKDLKKGTITRERAKELFESLWLNMSEAMLIFVTPTGGIAEGYAHFEGVTLGGKTRAGKDATNELSYLILESKDRLPTPYPDLAVRRAMCLHAPKYGNNDPYADSIGVEIEKIHMDYLKTIRGLHGELLTMRMVPVTNHLAMGKITGSSANGRKATMYLSEGTSASQGSDMDDPMAPLISNVNTKNTGYKGRQARLLNLDLNPSSVNGEEGTTKLMSLITSWCDMKLYHIQFNIINKETLVAAQRDTKKYKDLIINVAGYNDYFTALGQDLQNEIIARTEYSV